MLSSNNRLFSAVSLTWRHSSFSLQKMNNNHPHNCCSNKKFRKVFTDVKSALPSLITAYHLTHQTLVFADCLRIRAATVSAVKFPDKFLPQCVVQAWFSLLWNQLSTIWERSSQSENFSTHLVTYNLKMNAVRINYEEQWRNLVKDLLSPVGFSGECTFYFLCIMVYINFI